MSVRSHSNRFVEAVVVVILVLGLPVAGALGDPVVFTMEVVAINGSPTGGATEVTAHPGDTLTIDFFLERWAPALLMAYQVTIDGTSLTSGESGSLDLTVFSCSSDEDCRGDSECKDGVCNDDLRIRCSVADQDCNDSRPCWTDDDCYGLECVDGFCVGQECIADPNGTFCDCSAALFIDESRSDYVFSNGFIFPLVDCLNPQARFYGNYRLGGARGYPGEEDPGTRRYLGTIMLTLSDSALGDFTISFLDDPSEGPRALQEDSINLPVDISSNLTVHAVRSIPVPTVSGWGLLVLALILLVAAKVYFGHWRAAKSAA